MENQHLGVEAINPNGQKPNGESPKNNNCASLDDTDSYFDKLPPGYRFKPYDSELVVDYLWRKIRNEPLPPNRIKEVKLYDYKPGQLAENYKPLGENEWYFFTPRKRKYPGGERPNRAAVGGYWKATGADKPVKSNDIVVGFKKALVFHKGKSPGGHKTGWIMHEFKAKTPSRIRKHDKDMRLDDWVLCRMYKKRKARDSSRSVSTGDQNDSFPVAQQTETELQATAATDMAAETFTPQGSGLTDLCGFGNQERSFYIYDDFFMYPQTSSNQNHTVRLPETIPQYSHYDPGQSPAWLPGQNSSSIPQTYPLASNQNFNQADNSAAAGRPTSTSQPMESNMKLEEYNGYNSFFWLDVPSEDSYFDDPLHYCIGNSDYQSFSG